MTLTILDLLGYVILICIWLIIFPQKKEQAIDLANHLIPFLFLYLGGSMMRIFFDIISQHPDHPPPESFEPEGEEE